MPPRIIRCPLPICWGVKPGQAAKWRPCRKLVGVPTAATNAVAVAGFPGRPHMQLLANRGVIMTNVPLHTPDTAPAESRDKLQAVQSKMGFIPN